MRTYKLKDIVTFGLGLTYTPVYRDEGVIFISSKNLSNDYLNLTDVSFISIEDYNSISKNAKPQKGDILFTRVGSNLGHPVIYDGKKPIAIFVSVGYLRVKKYICNEYIKYWMQSKSFWRQVDSQVSGSSKMNLNIGWMSNFKIVLPTLNKQYEVSFVLHTIDDRINTQKKIINSKRSLIKSISQHFFMNAIPNVELKNIVTINKGKQVNGNLLNDTFTYSFFNGGSEASGKYNDYNAENFISISEGGNSCGYVNYVKGKFWSGGHNYTLTPTKEINLEYLYTFLKYKEQELMSLRVGTGLPNIQKSSLYKFKIYMPDYNIQNKIALIFTKLRESIENEEKNLKLYQKQKDYLLNKMFI